MLAHRPSLLPTGLRGVGKTVLLNRFVEDAKQRGYIVAQLEASESETFVEVLATEVRRALFELSAKSPIRNGITVALSVLKSFTLTFGTTDLSLKGMIYSPKHGDTAFTVPLFDAFMRRSMTMNRP